jgi:hypothetical protein
MTQTHPTQKLTSCPSINCYFLQSLRLPCGMRRLFLRDQVPILILEILQWFPVVNLDIIRTSSLTLRKLSHFWMDTTSQTLSAIKVIRLTFLPPYFQTPCFGGGENEKKVNQLAGSYPHQVRCRQATISLSFFHWDNRHREDSPGPGKRPLTYRPGVSSNSESVTMHDNNTCSRYNDENYFFDESTVDRRLKFVKRRSTVSR